MAEPELSVLLRNGAHDSTATNNTTRVRYALQCDNCSIQIAKTPIQIPIPQKSPELVDLGIFRPSISINGLIPTVGSGTATATGYEGMEFFSYTRGGNSNWYYMPYKNKLEETAYKWISSSNSDLELEIGDAATPTGSNHTGGGLYKVAIQQVRFQVDASREDRWTFAIQFVCKSRGDVTF